MIRHSVWFAVAMLLVLVGAPRASAQRSWDGGAGTFVWGDFNNWSPNGDPAGNDISIGNLAAATNDTTLVDASYAINLLTITNGADVINSTDAGATTEFELIVNGATTISNPGSSITIYGGVPDGLDTDSLTINSGGALGLNSEAAVGTAVVEVDTGALTNNVGGTIFGNGRIDLEGNPVAVTALLNNEGTLTASSFSILFVTPATTLQITATSANARVDLDGVAGGAGIVNVNRNATLDVDVPISDFFSGDLNLSAGATLDIAGAWTIDSATVDVNTPGIAIGTGGPAAHLAGGAITITGGTLTLDDGLDGLVIDAVLNGVGGVINNSGMMTFNAATTIQAGVDFNMIGGDSKLIVNSVLNIDTPDFNLDGTGTAGNVTTINAGGNLDLDLGAGADEDFQHTINLNGGELDVTTADNSWGLNVGGVINAAGAATSTINGETFLLSGTGGVNVAAGSQLNVNATTEITGSPTFNIAATGVLNFATVTYGNAGATYTGAGTLLKGTATFSAATTWNVAVVDLDDGATTLNADLTINANTIDNTGDGFDSTLNINSSDLTVNTPAPWRMEGVLNIDNQSAIPTINGSRMIVGDADDAAVNVGANGGNGVHNMNAPLTLETNGVVNIAVGAIFQVSGDTVFEGGQVTGGGSYLPASNNTVNAGSTNSTIDAALFDFDRGSWTINPGAGLEVDVVDYDSDSVTNSFNSTITINSGVLATFSDDAAFVVDAATVNLNNTVDSYPTWHSDPIEFGNDAGTLDTNLVVSGGGSSILAPVTFFSDANVTVNAGAILALAGATTNFNSVNGGNNASFTGGGELHFLTFLNFNEVTTLSVGRVDLTTNDFEGSTITVNADTTINVDTMASFGRVNFDRVNDILVLNNDASLIVNLTNPDDEWTISSPAIVNINASDSPLVDSGIQGADVNVNGTVNVNGKSVWNARVDVAGTINITLADDVIQLNGGGASNIDPNRLEGGTFNGPGQLALDFGHSLVGHGTINSDIQFVDVGTRVAADDGTLTINGDFVGFPAGSTGTNDADGILNVVNPWDSILFVSVSMNGGEIRGGTITNNTRIEGFGLISARVINNSSIRAQLGGTLIVETAGNDNDWDGTDDFALLYALGGNLELRDNASFPFSGRVWAQVGREVFANGFELEFEPASTLVLDGGTYRSTHATDFGGTVTIGAGTSTLQIAGTTVLENTSNTTLTGDLQLDNAATRIDAGATFSGGGTLINLAGRTLTLADGADVDVLLQNDGTFVLGASAGQTQGLAFQQTASGVWEVELGGTGADDFDRLELTGAAILDGTLELSLLLPYQPSLGDTMQILSAAGGLAGTTFADVIQPAAMPAGLLFDVIYNPTNVELVVVSDLPGDYNQNGVVDAADYTVWRDQLDQMFTLPNENPAAATPGLVDQEDYDFWKANFGLTLGTGSSAGASPSLASVPEPASALLLMLGVAGVRLRRCGIEQRVSKLIKA